MASVTIPNLDDALERRLHTQVDSHSRLIEDEACDILDAAPSREPLRTGGLVASIRAKFAPLGEVELPRIPVSRCVSRRSRTNDPSGHE